jgi:hypothetical protein
MSHGVSPSHRPAGQSTRLPAADGQHNYLGVRRTSFALLHVHYPRATTRRPEDAYKVRCIAISCWLYCNEAQLLKGMAIRMLPAAFQRQWYGIPDLADSCRFHVSSLNFSHITEKTTPATRSFNPSQRTESQKATMLGSYKPTSEEGFQSRE